MRLKSAPDPCREVGQSRPIPNTAEDTPTPDSLFDSGKKVKPKKNDKSEVIVELMMQNLEIKENEMELKKKQREDDAAMLARAEEREQKLISIMELLVNHIVKKD